MSVSPQEPACPIPRTESERILLAHGEGGRLTRRLIRETILPLLDNDALRPLADGALVAAPAGRMVLTTDSYVVSPLFFPGGDIGKLAVHGTVNDLAVCGARPLYLTLGLILEEGLLLETLRRVLESVASAARVCGVCVVTGDTKVVPRGAADGLFLNTTGVGELRSGVELGAETVRPGDCVLVSGTLGDHGITILSTREALDLGPGVVSDTAPLHELVDLLLDSRVGVRFLRDATRGGVSSVLHEMAESAGVSVILDEASLPVSEAVRGACEILGLEPLYVANEGKLVAVVAPEDAGRALAMMRGHRLGSAAAIIGEVRQRDLTPVQVRGILGAVRALDEPAGAPLPRIC